MNNPCRRNVDAAAVDAARRLLGVAGTTPLQRNDRLSAAHRRRGVAQAGGPAGRPVLQGARRLQPHRPARPRTQRAAGVVCASAGNHGQGVALRLPRACGVAGPGRTCPRTTPRQKRERIAALGGAAGRAGRRRATPTTRPGRRRGRGRRADRRRPRARLRRPPHHRRPGHRGAEIVEQLGAAPDVVVRARWAAVGCSPGSAAGCAERHPDVRWSASSRPARRAWRAALAAGAPGDPAELDTFVDGAAVRRVGDVTFPLVRDRGRRAWSPCPRARVCTEMLDALPVRRDHRRAGRCAGRGRPGRRAVGRRAGQHRWCAWCPAATTT